MPSGLPATAAVVSHDQLLCEGVKAILEARGFVVCSTSSLLTDVLRNPDENARPDVLILLRWLLSDAGLVQALKVVRSVSPRTRIIVLTDNSDAALLESALGAGADALLPTSVSAEILVQAIRLVLLGETFMSVEFVYRLLSRTALPSEEAVPDLTSREAEIISLVAQGLSNKVIADRMNSTETAVKLQVRRLLRKIGAANRTQAAIWAVERGLSGDRGSPLKAIAGLATARATSEWSH